MMLDYKIGYRFVLTFLSFASLFLANNLSAQYEGISNVRNWYFKGIFQDVVHHVEGEYTYSFYSVDADTFFYEDQFKIAIPYKRHDVLLLKIDRNGKVVNHAKFNTRKIEDDTKSTTYTQYPQEVISKNGVLYFNIRTGGHLYFNDQKIEGNYEKTIGNDLTNNNNVIIGLNQDFEIEYSKIFYGYNVTVNSLAFRENEMYILGTFFRDSMNIGGENIYKPGHVLTTKGYLYVYDLTQDTLVAKSCFAWGANTMILQKIRFDQDGYLNICVNHDSYRIFLGDSIVYGNFPGSNPLVVKMDKAGQVLNHFDGYIPNRKIFFVDAVPEEGGSMIIFGSSFNYNTDSLSKIRQYDNSPILGKTNNTLFIIKVDKNYQTEWYKLIEQEGQASHGIGDLHFDQNMNTYLIIVNNGNFRMMDEEGNEYESGLNLCKMNPDGHMEYIHHFYDFFTFFYSMDILEENVLSINTFLKFRKNDMEKIFGRQLRHQVDGVIFDFDMTSMFTGVEDEIPEKKKDLSIYPNPVMAGTPIHIQNSNITEGQYGLFTMEGKEVESGTLNGSCIHLKSEASGVYILKMKNRQIQISKKIIIYSY